MWMLLVLACASDDGDKNGEDTQPFMPPDALGLYSVSTQSVEVMSRHGFELPTQVWYPTTEESDDLHVYGDIKESPMAIDDADPDCSQIRPVVAFSHGNTGMRFQSYFLESTSPHTATSSLRQTMWAIRFLTMTKPASPN